ncbi:MAG: DUF4832 domain-containing protein [Lysobacteraceae bacterium]
MRPASRAALILLALAGNHVQASTAHPARTSDTLHNPHKGFMLWGTTAGTWGVSDNFYGASIHHIYLPWREVETADQVFDWDGVETRHFDPILAVDPDASFVLRLVADYPDGPGSGIDAYYSGGQNDRDYPLFLEASLGIGASNYASCDGDGPGRTPDWNDADMAAQLVELVQAFAARYDGDPRITAVQVGLLGLWGEWHQSGCDANAPGDAVKIALRDAYTASFTQTPLQTRYPRTPDISGVDFGIHEDYFPSFTANCVYGFPFCSDDGDWSMEWSFANLNPSARDNWRANPISGESPRAAQMDAWITDIDDVETVIRDYHFSFLGPAGKHEQAGFATPLARLERALGYNLHADTAEWTDPITLGQPVSFSVELANSGSGPVYHDYRLQLEWVNGGGSTVAVQALAGDPRSVVDDNAVGFSASVVPASLAPGSYSLRLRLADTTPGRPDIVIQSADRDVEGRVILGSSSVVADPSRVFGDGFED